MNNKKLGIILLLFVFLTPLQAFSQNNFYWTGVVTGQLKGFSKLGQYCEDNGFTNCTAAKYKEADYNRYQPLREMKVRVFINGALAGQGSTNQFGSYKISWLYVTQYYQPPSVLKIHTALEHKGGHFQVFDADESPHYFWGTTSNITIGSTTTQPQNLGTWYWGSANSPKPTMQAYEAAWRTWYYAFRYSNRLANHFNGLKIYYKPLANDNAFYSDGFKLEINAYNAYSMISHEMGHAASYKASNGQQFKASNQYCYPSSAENPWTVGCYNSSNNGHAPDSEEWASVQFEEGLATFLGNVSAYWSGNPEPLACDSSMQFLPCSSFNSGTIFLENSDAYAGTVSRHEEDVAKYLRDLYDASNPNPNATNEYRDTTNLNFYHIVDSINDFTSSYGNGGKNEPFSGGNYDDLDGRSARDFQHYVDIVGNISYAQSNSLYWMNGIPAGAY